MLCRSHLQKWCWSPAGACDLEVTPKSLLLKTGCCQLLWEELKSSRTCHCLTLRQQRAISEGRENQWALHAPSTPPVSKASPKHSHSTCAVFFSLSNSAGNTSSKLGWEKSSPVSYSRGASSLPVAI